MKATSVWQYFDTDGLRLAACSSKAMASTLFPRLTVLEMKYLHIANYNRAILVQSINYHRNDLSEKCEEMKRSGKSHKTSVLIIDPRWIYRNGFKHLILKRTGHSHVLEAEDIAAALEKLSSQSNIKLIVMPLLDMTGNPRIADILNLGGGAPVLIVSEDCTRQEILDAIDCGAAGCISKSAGEEDIVRAIEYVESGAIHISKTMFDSADQLHQKDRETPGAAGPTGTIGRLTPRQGEVLAELRRGCSNQNIADQLQISINTVKIHVAPILKTLGAENRTCPAPL